VPDGAGTDEFSNEYGARSSPVEFSATYSGTLALGNMFSTWFTDDVFADRPLWKSFVDDQEETFVLSLHSPVTGPALLTGTADLGGFVHYRYNSSSSETKASDVSAFRDTGRQAISEASGLLEFPPFSFWEYTKTNDSFVGEGLGWASTIEKATSGEFPAAIVRVSAVPSEPSRTGLLAVSVDGGHDWDFRFSSPLELIDVAVAPHDEGVMIVEQAGGFPMRSKDGGRTFASLQESLPFYNYTRFSGNRYNQSRQLCSLPLSDATVAIFVHLHCESGTLRVSVDGKAETWAEVHV